MSVALIGSFWSIILHQVASYRSGGQWLVTDMTRTRNIIEMCDSVKAAIETGIINEGSNLTGVNSACVWSDRFIPRELNFLSYLILAEQVPLHGPLLRVFILCDNMKQSEFFS